MFEAFYGMTATPFTRDLPPEALYASPALDELLGRLAYAAARPGFAVVTGDCGTGKSTAIRRLAARLDRAPYHLLVRRRFDTHAAPLLQGAAGAARV